MLLLLSAIIVLLFSLGCPANVIDEEVVKNILYAMEFYGEWLFTATGPESGTDKLTITNLTILQESNILNAETGDTIGNLELDIVSFDQSVNHILTTVKSATGIYSRSIPDGGFAFIPGQQLYGTYRISDTVGDAVLYFYYGTSDYPAIGGSLMGPYYKQ